MVFDIATGQSSPGSASTSSRQPPVAADTPRWPSQAPPATVIEADTITPQAERLAGYQADCVSAQSAAMAAELDRRATGESDIRPLGASPGYQPVMAQPVAGPGVGLSDVDLPVRGMGY